MRTDTINMAAAVEGIQATEGLLIVSSCLVVCSKVVSTVLCSFCFHARVVQPLAPHTELVRWSPIIIMV